MTAAAVGAGSTVDDLPGVGPRRQAQLAEAGVVTVADLLFHLPHRWQDRRRLVTVAECDVARRTVTLRGRISAARERGTRRRGLRLLTGVLDDGSGTLPVCWFHPRGIAERLKKNDAFVVHGALSEGPEGSLQLVNPEFEGADESEDWVGSLVPVYPPIGPLRGRWLRRLVGAAAAFIDEIEDPLPDDVRREFSLPALKSALLALHRPDADLGDDDVRALESGASPAHRRLAFDELLAFSIGLAEVRRRRLVADGPVCRIDESLRRFLETLLPFELTAAQRRVLGEITSDMEEGSPMARLVQGDVGSGKTAVAALAMLVALENGYQTAMMAPTELLAEQHVESLRRLFSMTRWTPQLLSGSMGSTARRDLEAGLRAGREPLVVGTHALFQEGVAFADLGLVVIDEQHRFGAEQRQALAAKGRSPHVLVMTATPIPRSLALTVYGDLDLSLIDELPPGRQRVRTEVRDELARDRVYRFLRAEIDDGGRVFVVYPLIDDSEILEAKSVSAHGDRIRSALPDVPIRTLHGRMSVEDRNRAYDDFRSGVCRVLLATTVVEVGLDVPEASVMVVENAERFGLAQLHQLRGRVGRGTRASWCILMVGDGAGDAARRRLALFAETSDGFRLAEADLEIRGMGELTGTRQWGPTEFRFARLPADLELAGRARAAARRLAGDGRLPLVAGRLALYHRVELEVPTG